MGTIELALYAKRTASSERGDMLARHEDEHNELYRGYLANRSDRPDTIAKKPEKAVSERRRQKAARLYARGHIASGKMIFISGRGGAAKDGKLPADFATQATNTFEDLKRCLAMAGATFKDVVKINYFVKDLSNTAELRKIRANYLNMDAPPAATLVQAGLGEGMLLEIEAVAIVPE